MQFRRILSAGVICLACYSPPVLDRVFWKGGRNGDVRGVAFVTAPVLSDGWRPVRAVGARSRRGLVIWMALIAAVPAVMAVLIGGVQSPPLSGLGGAPGRLAARARAGSDGSLSSQALASPGGVRLWWGRHGAVSFAARDTGLRAVLRPLSIGRPGSRASAAALGPQALAPREISHGRSDAAEALGAGVTASYRVTKTGIEQRFTVARRPAGAGRLVLSQRLGGGLRAAIGADGVVRFSARSGPVLTYSGLRVTDASGRVLRSRLTLAGGGRTLRIVVGDRGAAYPLTIDPALSLAGFPLLALNSTAAATLSGSGSEGLGSSVAVSADGETAVVGAPLAAGGAAHVYQESGGSWSSTPVASFTGSSGEGLGGSVAVSADGRTLALSAPAAGGGAGAVYVYQESGGSWSSTPVATFTGSANDSLGSALALSADGQTVVAGASGAGGSTGEVLVYRKSAGSWSSAPVATFTGTASVPLGVSVAVSGGGQTVVAGSPTASGDGEAVLYSESGGSWPSTATATFAGSGSEALGSSVAVSEDGGLVVAGAPEAGSNAGAVEVYDEVGGSWPSTPTTTFAGSGAEHLGYSVAASADGRTVAAGTHDAGGGPGAVAVYANEDNGNWSQTTLSGSGTEALGSSVSLSADGQTVLAGAPAAGTGAGASMVYGSIAGGWSSHPLAEPPVSGVAGLSSQVAVGADGASVISGDPAGSQAFAYGVDQTSGAWVQTNDVPGSTGSEAGYSDALSGYGGTIVVGGPAAHGGAGEVVIFDMTTGSLTTLEGTGTEALGSAVAIADDGRTVVAGAPAAGSGDGAVLVYHESGGVWSTTPVATFGGSGGERLGSAVAVAGDGRTVVAGAPAAGSNAGAVEVYEESGGWSGTPVATFGGSGGERLGSAVAVAGDGRTVVAGAPAAGSNAGAVEVYEESGGWSSTPTASFAGSGTEQLGYSVALAADGQTLVAGAPFADSESGEALVYTNAGAGWSNKPAGTLLGSSAAHMGYSVALTPDGQTVLATGTGVGHGFMFRLVPATTTTVSNQSAVYSAASHSVTLSATVSSSTKGTLGSGTVKFTVKDGSGGVVGTPVSGAVSNGSASVEYTLPAEAAVGSYAIEADYTNSEGAYADSSDNAHSLTVEQSSTTTQAAPASAAFSPTAQSVTLNASVTSAAGTVDEGSVEFAIKQGSTVIGTPVSGSVSGGSASVVYALPAGAAAGSYTIQAEYSDSGGTFADSSDGSHSLTVGEAGTSTAAVAAGTTYSPGSQSVDLSASVGSAAGTVDQGSVLFTIEQGATVVGTPVSGPVSGGSASVAYALPAGTAAGSYTIVASYSDSAGDFGSSSDDTHDLTIGSQSQTIAFAAPASPVLVGESVGLSATGGSSGRPVQLSVDPSSSPADACSVSQTASGAGTVVYQHAGTCVIDATQAASADGNYAAAPEVSRTVTVDPAATGTSLSVSAGSLSATVSAVAPGAGIPSGSVSFRVDGSVVGTAPLSGGVATLAYTVATGASHQISATYEGTADFTGSSASAARNDPSITAHLSSARPRSRDGWYRTPVTITFSCQANGAPLTGACPAAVTLSGNGAGQSVTRTISAGNGGAATIAVSGIDIDQTPPAVKIAGARDGGIYEKAPTAACASTDQLSGVASCTIHTRRSTSRSGLAVTTVRYTLKATDKAGNTSTTHGAYKILGIYLQGVPYRHGLFDVRANHAYTLVVAHSPGRPRYIDAAPAPNVPSGEDNFLHKIGPGRWAIVVLIPQTPAGRRWDLGVKLGRTTHQVPVREP
jgi:Bacterial Ig-like domain (group 3)